MAKTKPPTIHLPGSLRSLVGTATTRAEAVRRARFQNLIWREARARATHIIRGSSGGPNAPQPDVPVEWLKELDRR